MSGFETVQHERSFRRPRKEFAGNRRLEYLVHYVLRYLVESKLDRMIIFQYYRYYSVYCYNLHEHFFPRLRLIPINPAIVRELFVSERHVNTFASMIITFSFNHERALLPVQRTLYAR